MARTVRGVPLEVSRLIDPQMLVEIEAEAILEGQGGAE